MVRKWNYLILSHQSPRSSWNHGPKGAASNQRWPRNLGLASGCLCVSCDRQIWSSQDVPYFHFLHAACLCTFLISFDLMVGFHDCLLCCLCELWQSGGWQCCDSHARPIWFFVFSRLVWTAVTTLRKDIYSDGAQRGLRRRNRPLCFKIQGNCRHVLLR